MTTSDNIKRKVQRLQATALLAAAALFASCTGDDFADDTQTNEGKLVTVNIKMSTDADNGTRWDGRPSKNLDNEKMFSWFTVAVDANGEIQGIFGENDVNDLEEDDLKDIELPQGTYTFYSFANIDRKDVLGDLTKGSNVKDVFENKFFTVNGNGFDITNYHIPMSNRQSGIAVQGGITVNLWVVRMLAKIELNFSNKTLDDITIKSATLSEITKNAENNLMLLPDPLDKEGSAACMPNLNGTPETTDFTYTPAEPVTVASKGEGTMTFYVNESATPTQNPHGLFTLTLTIDKGNGNGEEYMRYALITNDEENNWNYIGRNDHRKIPITLQDYKLDIIPYDFPPIGVYPASVKEEDGLFTVTFHAAGHFHLVPVVTKYSTGEKVPFSNANGETNYYWTFESWTPASYAIFVPKKASSSFYVKDYEATEDGCENGAAPVWVESSQAIIGNLYEGDLDEGETAKAYHDLEIQVYENSQAPRTLTYHLCLVKEITY